VNDTIRFPSSKKTSLYAVLDWYCRVVDFFPRDGYPVFEKTRTPPLVPLTPFCNLAKGRSLFARHLSSCHVGVSGRVRFEFIFPFCFLTMVYEAVALQGPELTLSYFFLYRTFFGLLMSFFILSPTPNLLVTAVCFLLGWSNVMRFFFL